MHLSLLPLMLLLLLLPFVLLPFAILQSGSPNPISRKTSTNSAQLLEKIAVMVVTSSADRPQIYSERVWNLSGLNHTKLKQDGGNPVVGRNKEFEQKEFGDVDNVVTQSIASVINRHGKG